MNQLAETVMLNASKRYAKKHQDTRNKKAPQANPQAPWNRLEKFADMRLYLCASVRDKLRELDEADYQRKHGRG